MVVSICVPVTKQIISSSNALCARPAEVCDLHVVVLGSQVSCFTVGKLVYTIKFSLLTKARNYCMYESIRHEFKYDECNW